MRKLCLDKLRYVPGGRWLYSCGRESLGPRKEFADALGTSLCPLDGFKSASIFVLNAFIAPSGSLVLNTGAPRLSFATLHTTSEFLGNRTTSVGKREVEGGSGARASRGWTSNAFEPLVGAIQAALAVVATFFTIGTTDAFVAT